jgi:cellulose synthase/poly-beta-1,6-N-acetylglucosamine synthase-like glycosyltransferase
MNGLIAFISLATLSGFAVMIAIGLLIGAKLFSLSTVFPMNTIKFFTSIFVISIIGLVISAQGV